MLKRADFSNTSSSNPGPFGLWDNKQGEGSVTMRSVLYNQLGESLVISCITKEDLSAMMSSLAAGEYLFIVSKFNMDDGFYPTMTKQMLAERFDILITNYDVFSVTGEYGDEGTTFVSRRTGLTSKLIKRQTVLGLLRS